MKNSNLHGCGLEPSPFPTYSFGAALSPVLPPLRPLGLSGLGFPVPFVQAPRAGIDLADVGGNVNAEHGASLAVPASLSPASSLAAWEAPTGSDSALLGISAKSSSAPLWVDPNTGEILSDTKEFNPSALRVERFALQSVARSILWGSRTAKCLRLVQAHRSDVEVWRSKEHGTAAYGGLQTCGSVWACPVCAAKISERRRVELLHAIEQHRADGGDVLLLTLTNPHKLSDSLAEAVERQAAAMSRFTQTRQALALRRSIGCLGTVRAWEVTHGANGWHPHFHILLFVRAGGLDLADLRERFYALWANSCRLAGLPVPEFMVPYVKYGKLCAFFGVDVQDGKQAAAYASKWGLESEMTKGHIKKAARGGRTPFDLLRARLVDDDKQASALFKEFAECFKGKRQLVWSKGLKALFAVPDLSDEELAAQQDERAALLGRITLDQWRAILKFDLRADVLELARYGWEPVQRLLDSLPAVPADRPATGAAPGPLDLSGPGAASRGSGYSGIS